METLVTIAPLTIISRKVSLLGEASEQICGKIGKCNYNMLLKFDFALREVDENGELKVMSNILLKISIKSLF